MRSLIGFLCVFFIIGSNQNLRAQQSRFVDQASSNAPILGNWEWTMQMGPMKKRMEMEVSEKVDELKATMVAPDGTKLESKEFSFKDNRIKFSITREMGPQSMTMAFDGVLKADKIDGSIQMTGGPMNQTIPWKAARVVKKKSSAMQSPSKQNQPGPQD